ncbi:DEAD/DEAH box helicase [uncultured Xanthomonas sp.]|uniref:DEAD/DEAH box helicase n=1 Tax=uncultured Xanthomonas sp. TaxID=152831 RepID=UPI0025F64972|nr:DEAD/DEAH box helicase [uncultured Xanthomonas sp.]
MSTTIQQSVSKLHQALTEYIEATYHIGTEALVHARKRLLDEPGNIHQVPFLESTPRYVSDRTFSQISGLHPSATSLLEALSSDAQGHAPLLHNPPYSHQAEAIEESIVKGNNLLIMTGTGSGKTESFLMPVLSKLAIEASSRPDAFADSAVRALLLYPMNALVNDQLGRLRSMFSDPRVTRAFAGWAGRIPRFARYTSRTPYAGVREKNKDDRRLKSLEEFYVRIERKAMETGEEADRARALMRQLQGKGKWPAKPNLATWLGASGSRWQDRTGDFVRAIARPDDSELITRHEVQAAPPDLLVTNYSMLEYMLMRPIERSIFDTTRAWLERNPTERFLIILDEAHLYRGAGGAEVGLLIRRLTDRLGVSADRIQTICATASFSDSEYAKKFGAQLSGCAEETFKPVEGNKLLGADAATGTLADAEALATIAVARLQELEDPNERSALIAAFLTFRGVASSGSIEQDLYAALHAFGPLQWVINNTMGDAKRLAALPAQVFPGIDADLAAHAFSNLLALGSMAKSAGGNGLLPCRVHGFFRGLPGLWVCMDPNCTEVVPEERNPHCGKMYSQPIKHCACGSTCLEFYTCRHCGAPYARAYTDDVEDPQSLWSEPGANIALSDGEAGQLEALDLLLQAPLKENTVVAVSYDVETGRLNAYDSGDRSRIVYRRLLNAKDLTDEDEEGGHGTLGQFIPCGICRGRAGGGKSSVQDHMTKGDQPFQALVARQIDIQPPGPKIDDNFAPLRGRKVLAFSDSRQVAARLAPNLQTYSMRDALRPLLVWGMQRLQQSPTLARQASLQDAYFATLLAARCLSVRLRPELKSGESFDPYFKIGAVIGGSGAVDEETLIELYNDYHPERAPDALLEELLGVIQDRYIGLDAIALGTLTVRPGKKKEDLLRKLPDIAGFATTEAEKLSLVGFWLRCWRQKSRKGHIWFQGMDNDKWQTDVLGQNGKFKAVEKLLSNKAAKTTFSEHWLPALLEAFAERVGPMYRLHAKNLYLELGGTWVRCANCASVHRPIANTAACIDCGEKETAIIDPFVDPVFRARKAYYRRATEQVLSDVSKRPLALIAAEHTAQLNSSDQEEAFSKAERNELLFQDINIAWKEQGDSPVAIDILSSTTTMEVGIDIGALSGVALRNMPPGRANYQQRAGRAGRRGTAVATVVAFGSVDSHDEHYFSHPEEMISGKVVDPILTLDNQDIAKRHIRAFLLQCYHQDRLPEFDPDQPNDLFSVLGKVGAFRDGSGVLNRDDLASWLEENEAKIKERVTKWLPEQLTADGIERLVDGMIGDCIKEIDKAISSGREMKTDKSKNEGKGASTPEQDPDVEQEKPPRADSDKLLDRLLYEGVLPRYAFPTDVATFHIFDRERSSKFQHRDEYAPSQGLPVALSQYAPGKQVWVGGKCYVSGAIYSRSVQERIAAWENRERYYECSVCRFARTEANSDSSGTTSRCPACGTQGSFEFKGEWMRPVGFAHPIDIEEETSPDRVPEVSYATRAKLTTKTPGDDQKWFEVNPRFKSVPFRDHLLVSNVGPKGDGYRYCTLCGRIEAMTEPHSVVGGPHRRPFPTDLGQENCRGRGVENVVLGAKFVTDIALFSLRVDAPMNLKPGTYASNVALRTISEALARAATELLGIEPGEILAEFRPAMSADASSALCAEIFLYDTLPGGAGFSSAIPTKAEELLKRSRKLLDNCPEKCDSSCYRCLRAFGNRIEHRSLDRHVGIELIDYLLTGVVPETETTRLEASTDLLFKDLSRLLGDNSEIAFERGAEITLGDTKYILPILCHLKSNDAMVVIGLSSTLKDGYAADANIRALHNANNDIEVIAVNELLVRSNLAAATKSVCVQLGFDRSGGAGEDGVSNSPEVATWGGTSTWQGS